MHIKINYLEVAIKIEYQIDMLITSSLLHGYSAPQHILDWIYFSSSAGRKFLHHSDVVHKFSEGVIMQRRKELLLKV